MHRGERCFRLPACKFTVSSHDHRHGLNTNGLDFYSIINIQFPVTWNVNSFVRNWFYTLFIREIASQYEKMFLTAYANSEDTAHCAHLRCLMRPWLLRQKAIATPMRKSLDKQYRDTCIYQWKLHLYLYLSMKKHIGNIVCLSNNIKR